MCLLMQRDLRGRNFYLAQLLSTLRFPWPQRLKVTRWGHCSQRFPHQPRCEFLTFLFVLFLSNIKSSKYCFWWLYCNKSFMKLNRRLVWLELFSLSVFIQGSSRSFNRFCSGDSLLFIKSWYRGAWSFSTFTSADASCSLHFREVNYIWQIKPLWTCPVSVITG